MPRVCILNTGGTIGMRETPRGLCPEPGFLAAQLQQMPELGAGGMPEHEVVEYDPVIDSANMSPAVWQRIAEDIAARYAQFDGFVVLHGTDTMAYTASALAFMLPELARPVILTGSQLPLSHIRNDARENLKTAMLLAGNVPIPEVCLFFGEFLLRGCRATKSSASRLDAFESPNYPPIGSAETALEVFPDRIRQSPPLRDTLTVHPIHSHGLATFRLFPGLDPAVLANLIRPPLRGLVLETYGVGNGPANQAEFLAVIRAAVDAGVVVVSCSQCRHGCVSQSDYEVGRVLADAGVTSGRDMTIEAAIAKLLYLFTRNSDPRTIRDQVGVSLAGELTPETSRPDSGPVLWQGSDSGRVRVMDGQGR